ncbi:MAG: acyl-[acyl-carrier-protein] thioesterase [Leptospira sp.]|nr:acyl-[acyl-carrier-protein] thioesterase [Leptospira sp.]
MFEKKITTEYYDLDWNRHVNSRTYEKFAYASRMQILKDFGYPISKMLNQEDKWISLSSKVRFLSQQFENSILTVKTALNRDKRDQLHFYHHIQDSNGIPVCNVWNVSALANSNGDFVSIDSVLTTEDKDKLFDVKLDERNPSWNTLSHNYDIPFTDMNGFWNLPTESIWKIFEEGRFLFFNEVLDLGLIKKIDTSTFFMGGEIEMIELPKPGTKVIIHSWIDSVEKIRFYFRQDIVSQDGKILVRMRDEQLFVALSTSRPRKAPKEVLEQIGKYIRSQ